MSTARNLVEMWDLPTIVAMNKRAAKTKPPETETTRHCSFNGNAQRGIVLHSAKMRSTLFLNPGEDANEFLTLWNKAKTQAERDALVEGYFIGESVEEAKKRRAKRVVSRLVDMPTV